VKKKLKIWQNISPGGKILTPVKKKKIFITLWKTKKCSLTPLEISSIWITPGEILKHRGIETGV